MLQHGRRAHGRLLELHNGFECWLRSIGCHHLVRATNHAGQPLDAALLALQAALQRRRRLRVRRRACTDIAGHR